MNQAMILSILRSVMIGLGSIAVAKGYIDNETLQSVVSSIIVIAAASWGALEKREPKP